MNKSVNESAEDIFKVIRETVKEHVKINVEYDDEMNVFFFRIMSTYDTFHKNFEVLDKLDEIFNVTRQKSPILYRWVMNAVRYEGYRWWGVRMKEAGGI